MLLTKDRFQQFLAALQGKETGAMLEYMADFMSKEQLDRT